MTSVEPDHLAHRVRPERLPNARQLRPRRVAEPAGIVFHQQRLQIRKGKVVENDEQEPVAVEGCGYPRQQRRLALV